jgi:hypothetical protein
METFSSIPLIDDDIVRELFTADDDPEMSIMQRELWEGVRHDLLQDLEGMRSAFAAGQVEEARKQAHRVAGYSGSGGLLRAGVALRALQHGEIPPEDTDDFLTEVEHWSRDGMAEIERRFPHLAVD